MNMLSISRMVVSSHDGWDELENAHPSLGKLLGFLVVPLSLLPPVMLYLAGSHYGDAFITGFGDKPWAGIAVLFFVTELFTFMFMGWLIGRVAGGHGARISTHDAYMLAGIAPIPLWLSSLSLLVPSLAFNIVVSMAALAISCSLIYHGIYALCHMHEEINAASIALTVISAGMIAWVLLLSIIV